LIGVDMESARDGDIARLHYPSAHLPANSCLHVDYQLIGHVQLEVGYQLNQQFDDGHLLCTLVPNSTHVGWFSTDILLQAGEYQLYFDAVVLSLEEGPPVVALELGTSVHSKCSSSRWTRSCYSTKTVHASPSLVSLLFIRSINYSCIEYVRFYRVAQNKILQQTICNFSATGCQILKILEAA